MLLLVLVQIRNWFGLWTVLVAGVGVFALTWWLPAPWQSIAATAVSAFLLVAAVRTVFELQGARRRERSGDTDADQLGRISGTPPILWVGVFLIIAVGAAVVGGALLLRLPLSVAAARAPSAALTGSRALDQESRARRSSPMAVSSASSSGADPIAARPRIRRCRV